MEVCDELLEDERVNVLAELVQQEPVTDTETPADRLHLQIKIYEYLRFVFDLE